VTLNKAYFGQLTWRISYVSSCLPRTVMSKNMKIERRPATLQAVRRTCSKQSPKTQQQQQQHLLRLYQWVDAIVAYGLTRDQWAPCCWRQSCRATGCFSTPPANVHIDRSIKRAVKTSRLTGWATIIGLDLNKFFPYRLASVLSP